MQAGSITFSTALDNKQLAKDLAKLDREIGKQERKVADLNSQRDAAKEKSLFDAAKLDAEKAKLQEIRDRLAELRAMSRDKNLSVEQRENYSNQVPSVQEELADQRSRVSALQTEWNKTESAVERCTARLTEAEGTLDRQKEEAGALTQQLNSAASAQSRMAGASARAGQYMDRFLGRVKQLASRVFVFTLITTALRALRTWLGKAVKTNSEATAAMAKLKGALLTLAQPLVHVVIPAFIVLVNLLTRVATVLASVASALFGTTTDASKEAAEGLYGEMSALEGVGDAAKKASQQMAGFDELNTIGGEDSDGGGSEIAPDFSFLDDRMDGILDRITGKVETLLPLISAVGAAFLLWKVSEALPASLGNIAGKLALVAIAIAGVILFWDGLKDAWENGVDWVNLAEMLGGVTAAALALGLAFGPIAAGIALVAGGAAMLAAAFQDIMENGFSLENTLLFIAGLLATGLGIALLTGSFIPALIAGIAALLLAVTVATGHGEELIGGVKDILQGFKDFFTGIFSRDTKKAVGGIGKIFDGLGKVFSAVIAGVRDTFLSFLTWLDEKTGGKFHGIIEAAKGLVTGFYDNMIQTVSNWLSGVKLVFQGLIEFLTGVFTGDWDRAWEGVKNIFKGMWNSNISLMEGSVNLIIRGLNWLISQINKIKFEVPSWVPGVGGKSAGFNIGPISELSIPRLAQGAVIPPNREFMAVLGDQKSGTNIETPLSTMIQAFKQAAREVGMAGGGRDITIILEIDRQTFARAVYRANHEETQRVGVSFAGVRT